MSSSALKLLAASGATDSATYVDDVFSTDLFAGTGSNQAITNGVDLSSEGGLVWGKCRNNANYHYLFDTERGVGKVLYSNDTYAEGNTSTSYLYAFNNDGFSMGPGVSVSGQNHVGWTFRKAPGFFDIVTYTGNGANRTIAHNLGSVPGMIIVKMRTLNGYSWQVYHRSLANTERIELDNTGAKSTGATTYWNSTTATDAVFSLGTSTQVNKDGDEYVAYLFAHDAQEFGADEDESIIKCGSYTGAGNGTSVTLGFEPQWLMVKKTSGSASWYLWDNMRGVVTGTTATNGNDQYLLADASNQEASQDLVQFNATGFSFPTADGDTAASGQTYIYMAIRRPFKPAEEFAATTDLFGIINSIPANSASNQTAISTSNQIDMMMGVPSMNGYDSYVSSRFQGGKAMRTQETNAEFSSPQFYLDYTKQFRQGISNSTDFLGYTFTRAPGFFDVVAYTAVETSPAAARAIPHNLEVAPEMIWVKCRTASVSWIVYHKDLGTTKYTELNENNNSVTSYPWNWGKQSPDASNFYIGTTSASKVNNSGNAYIAYLFASVDGISKVGSYTGNGSTLNVDCGFSAGARLVLIKRDGYGSWYYWDSVRGIVAGNDPYLLLNQNAAEVTNTDYLDPLSSGFTLTASAGGLANEQLNVNGGTYLFYAIA